MMVRDLQCLLIAEMRTIGLMILADGSGRFLAFGAIRRDRNGDLARCAGRDEIRSRWLRPRAGLPVRLSWSGEFVGVQFQHTFQHRGQWSGHFRSPLPAPLRCDGRQRRAFIPWRAVRGPGNRNLADQELVQRRFEAVDVRPDVDPVAVAGLFGRHEVARAHDLARQGELAENVAVFRGQQGQAQVEDFHQRLECTPDLKAGLPACFRMVLQPRIRQVR